MLIGRYVGNEPDSLFALEEIQKTAALMRFELERGNVDGFASLLDYHWELSKKVDAGSSNTLIEQIFSSIEELIDGKLVCGAGGGGFLAGHPEERRHQTAGRRTPERGVHGQPGWV